MTAVDTNVLIDIAEGDTADIESVVAMLSAAPAPLVIAPIVYAELCAHPGWAIDEVDDFLRVTTIIVHWNLAADIWREAGTANGRYARRRRESGAAGPRRIAADFLIGAHATTVGRLVTRDAAFFERNFPTLAVLVPGRA